MASLADNNLLQYLDVLDGKLVLNADALVASAEAERAKAIETVKANAFAKLSALALKQEAEASEEAEIAAFNTSVQVSGAAKAFADFITFSSPEAIILFGGLAKSGDLLMNPIKNSLDKNILKVFKGKTKILLSELKESDAAVLGASSLGWEAK